MNDEQKKNVSDQALIKKSTNSYNNLVPIFGAEKAKSLAESGYELDHNFKFNGNIDNIIKTKGAIVLKNPSGKHNVLNSDGTLFNYIDQENPLSKTYGESWNNSGAGYTYSNPSETFKLNPGLFKDNYASQNIGKQLKLKNLPN